MRTTLSGQLLRLLESTRGLSVRTYASGGGVIGPVYRAQKTGYKLRDISYWADRPRFTAFGGNVIKATIRIRHPYEGDSSHAAAVAELMSDEEIIDIFKRENYDYERNAMFYEGLQDQFVDFLSRGHYEGMWQDDAAIRAIKRAGFDGVISADPHGGETEYVVFSRKQVKVLATFGKSEARKAFQQKAWGRDL